MQLQLRQRAADEGESSAPQNRDLRLREHTPTQKDMFEGPEVSYHQNYSARDWLSILRTSYPTQNLQRNWKTEEELARAAVTVETERIKGSNP